MPREIRNMAASVHARLLNRSRENGRPFQEMLEYYAMERFLFRLAASPHADKFVLKGGLMLMIWRAALSRPTRDIDVLGHMENEVPTVVATIKDICQQPTDDDGLIFDADSCQGEIITPEKEYAGVRVRFTAYLGRAQVPMQVDVGFGDIIVPGAIEVDYPPVLDSPPARLLAYSRESVIAEKLEAMVKRGEINSRTKDFLDIWLISEQYDFSGEDLCLAIRRTFDNRGTLIRPHPVCMTEPFAASPERQRAWQGLLVRNRISNVPNRFTEVVARIALFAGPLLEALAASSEFDGHWVPPGPWSLDE